MKKLIFTTLLIAGLIFPCQSDSQQKKVKVLTTLNYLKYVAERIGGDRVTVTALANPKQDPHYVTPTPPMNELANDADVFIEHGLSLDAWAKNVVDASGNPRIQPGTPGHLTATLNAPVKELPAEISRAWGDIHPQGNPHVWLDPLNIKIIADNVSDRFQRLDPVNAAFYAARAETLKAQLDVALFGQELVKILGKKAGDILTRKARGGDLMNWLRKKNLETSLGGWLKKADALRGLKVISYHKTYVYFADRFGLTIAAELEEKPGIPPPPKHRDAIVELVRREGIGIILNDNFYARDAAEYVASKTGAHILVSYIEVGAAEEIDTYEKLITYLLERLIRASST